MSQAFANAGLQFFKRDKTIVHVSVARPHYLDLSTQVVSDGVKKIVSYIEANPKTTRKQLIDALAPASPAIAAPVAEPAAAAPAVAEGAEAAPAPAAAAPVSAPVTQPEREAVLTDLHWLLHQGHVVELASGTMELAQKPNARPEPAPGQAPAEGQRRQGGQGARGERPPRQPRQDRTPWSRKHGLLPVTNPGYPAYSALPQLAGI